MAKHKTSIIKGTKEGALYIELGELFKQSDVRELVHRLLNSELKKSIQSKRNIKTA